MIPALCLALLLQWPTHRGDAARTGNADGKEGPSKAKVLWSEVGQDHYLAAPAVAGDRLIVSALGAFNTASLHAVGTGPQRRLWSKLPPFLKQPTVCAAAVAEGRAVLGDGMHQTDGASLLSVRLSDGLLLWKLDVTGTLVHIEGGATIAGGRIYVGAGSGGLLCVDPSRLSLDGKPTTAAEAEKALDARWKELLARYEADRKKDPDFAIPPSEDALPKAAPAVAWRVGHDGWHVDAPTTVAGDRVLAASSYLDHEKLGERALFCVAAADGAVVWKLPLGLNPWAGATVSSDRVIVGGSSIRYDVKTLGAARGEVVAAKLSDGSPLWKRELPAGVLGSIAANAEVAIVADTSGRVQALGLADGKTRWTYEAGSAFFAGAALGPARAYVADLKGRVHALNLSDGKAAWTVELAPGMVYGAPVLSAGRLYVGTGNVEGPFVGKPTALACIGDMP